MLRVLLKKQLSELFRGYFYNQRTNQRRSSFGIAAYFVIYALILVVILGGMFLTIAGNLCAPLAAAGAGWLYYLIFVLISVILGVFASVLTTYSGLYLAKDNDLLLSMPVRPRDIIAARLIGVYVMGASFSLTATIPAVIAYLRDVSHSLSAILGGVLFCLLTSIIVMILSCALGWAVAKISLRFRSRNGVVLVATLVLIAAYYYFYFRLQSGLQDLIANAAVYAEGVRSMRPLYLLGRCAEGDLPAMLLCSAVILGLFALTIWLLSHTFLGIATASGAAPKKAYREQTARLQTPLRALTGKELRRFTSSANYMLNCGIGCLLLILAGVALLIKGRELTGVLAQLFGSNASAVPVLLCALVCAVAATSDSAVPSVALEGRNLWLVRSLPVRTQHVLQAKLLVELLVTMPCALFAGLCAAVTLRCSILQAAVLLLAVAAVCLLFACFHLRMGLVNPNVNWTNEVIPVKQSLNVGIALFAGMLYGMAIAGVYLAALTSLSWPVYLLIVAAVSLLIGALLYRSIMKRGVQVFEAL